MLLEMLGNGGGRKWVGRGGSCIVSGCPQCSCRVLVKPATHTAAHLDTRTLSALLQAIALRSPGTQGLQSVDDPAVQPLLTADDFDHTRWVGCWDCLLAAG